MEMSSDNIFSPKGQDIRGKAKKLTGKKQERYIKGRLGLVIDGTGKDPENIQGASEKLKEIGYDVAMIFVNTDLDTAIKRDAMRSRTIGAREATKYWKLVQSNVGKFQTCLVKKISWWSITLKVRTTNKKLYAHTRTQRSSLTRWSTRCKRLDQTRTTKEKKITIYT